MNSTGVPSIAKWVRVGSSPYPNCDEVAPAVPTNLDLDLLSDTEAWLLWTAPGDDGTGGGAVSEYDLRGSTQSITDNATLCAGRRGNVPPFGGPLNGPSLTQDGSVTGLTSCTQYHMAVKARDDADNWGPISSELVITTLCGPGGGFGAQQNRSLLAARTLGPGGPGEPERGPAPEPEGPSPSGAGRSAQTLGLIAATAAACAAEIAFADDAPTWTIYPLSPEADVEAFGTDSAGILVQEPDPRIGWRVTRRLFPGPFTSRVAMRGMRRAGRYVFRGPNTFQQAWAAVATGTPGEVYQVISARHSRLGDQTAAMELAGSTTATLGAGDSLTITYHRTSQVGIDPHEWFVLMGTEAASGSLAQANRGEPQASPSTPAAFALHTIQPNPFSRATTVRFALPRPVTLRLDVFDLLGRRVRTLADGEYPAGEHGIPWDGTDGDGRAVLPGVYLCRMVAGPYRAQRTMVVLGP